MALNKDKISHALKETEVKTDPVNKRVKKLKENQRIDRKEIKKQKTYHQHISNQQLKYWKKFTKETKHFIDD